MRFLSNLLGRRGGGVAAAGDARRARVNEVWSADAGERAEACGWYWMAHPMVRERINVLASGRADRDAYGHLEVLLRARGWEMPIERCISLGCGFGALERDLARRGMIREIDAYDLAEGAIAEARRFARAEGHDGLRYHVADLEALHLPAASLDAVFAHQSVHHVEGLEGLFTDLRRALRPGGILHLHEFVGPTRFQWTGAQLEAVNALMDSLPPRLRRLPSGEPKGVMRRPTLEAMLAVDPSEAIRSADIMRVLPQHFEILEERRIGGALLHLALGDIAQNFDGEDPEDHAHLERFFALEDALMSEGRIGSDYVVVTAARPD